MAFYDNHDYTAQTKPVFDNPSQIRKAWEEFVELSKQAQAKGVTVRISKDKYGSHNYMYAYPDEAKLEVTKTITY